MKQVLEMHLHTHHSKDSLMQIPKIIHIAKERGLTGLAITDHNTFQGVHEAQKYNKDPSFFIIPGMEIKTEFGDVIGLFLISEIKSRKYTKVVQEIHAQKGLVVFPHPFSKNSSFKKTLLNDIDLIEVFNSRNKSIWNEKATEIALQEKIPAIVGSDAHNYFEVGRSRTIVYGASLEKIKKNLLVSTHFTKKYTNYYLSHGLSFLTEKTKALI